MTSAPMLNATTAGATGLSLQRITKRYGERVVLENASLTLSPGRIRALVGENGAGKSTLVKIAAGLVEPDAGDVTVDGMPVPQGNARVASARGIGVVHQHFMLVETMTVAQNVVLGFEPRRGPLGLLLDRDRARREVRALGERYGLGIDPDAPVASLAVGERQRVELLKVLYRGARYVLFDEPTAVLSPGEIQALLQMLRGLAEGGAGVAFVSHKLDEVLAVANEITVIRRGRVVLERERNDTRADEIARAVVGGELPISPARAKRDRVDGEGIRLVEVQAPGLASVSLLVRAGEIVGVAGVEGSGQRTLAYAIAGLTPLVRGEVLVGGQNATRWSVAERRAEGLGFVPEDREGTGLFAQLSIAENLALGDARIAAGSARRSERAAREAARVVIERYGIRPADPDTPVGALSGGNAQKVLIARELSRSVSALVIAQPTRGIDMGSSVEVHAAIREACDRGVAVLLITSDLDELRLLSDRIIVMRGGTVVGELPVSEATDARLGSLMVGTG